MSRRITGRSTATEAERWESSSERVTEYPPASIRPSVSHHHHRACRQVSVRLKQHLPPCSADTTIARIGKYPSDRTCAGGTFFSACTGTPRHRHAGAAHGHRVVCRRTFIDGCAGIDTDERRALGTGVQHGGHTHAARPALRQRSTSACKSA